LDDENSILEKNFFTTYTLFHSTVTYEFFLNKAQTYWETCKLT
jgi:hypothetical protein